MAFFIFIDIDECSDNTSNVCDVNANCTNTEGSHYCTCRQGYTGSGKECQGKNYFRSCSVLVLQLVLFLGTSIIIDSGLLKNQHLGKTGCQANAIPGKQAKHNKIVKVSFEKRLACSH